MLRCDSWYWCGMGIERRPTGVTCELNRCDCVDISIRLILGSEYFNIGIFQRKYIRGRPRGRGGRVPRLALSALSLAVRT